jgi:hypothetical protein
VQARPEKWNFGGSHPGLDNPVCSESAGAKYFNFGFSPSRVFVFL